MSTYQQRQRRRALRALSDWLTRGANPVRVRLVLFHLGDAVGGLETAITRVAETVRPWSLKGKAIHPAMLESYLYGGCHLDPQDLRAAAHLVASALRPALVPGATHWDLEIESMYRVVLFRSPSDPEEWGSDLTYTVGRVREDRQKRLHAGWRLPGAEARP